MKRIRSQAHREQVRAWKASHPEEVRAHDLKRNELVKRVRRIRSEAHRQQVRDWKAAHPERPRKRGVDRPHETPEQRRRQYLRNRQRPAFVVASRLRARVKQLVRRKRIVKSAATLLLIGCDRDTFVRHIEASFLPGMSWDNRRLWHIDHVRACAKFDLSDPAQQRACFHYTNMRPLWAPENQRKGAV